MMVAHQTRKTDESGPRRAGSDMERRPGPIRLRAVAAAAEMVRKPARRTEVRRELPAFLRDDA
jgi:hypothetical protein